MSREEQVHQGVLDLLAKAMQDVEASEVIGYVVLSYDDVGAGTGTQMESATVLGPFVTEMEAVAYAARHFEQVNRGVPEGSTEGWLTMVKPLIRTDDTPPDAIPGSVTPA